MMRSLLHFIKESLSNARRNFGTTFGAVVTIFLSLLVIGVFMVGTMVIDRMIQGVESEVNVQIFLNDKATDAEVKTLQDYISNHADVASVEYVSKEQALEQFKETSDADIVAQLDENPLPAKLSVELKDPEQVKAFVDEISGQSILLKVVEKPDELNDSIRYGQEIVESLFAFTNVIRLVCLILVIMLVFVALVFINNTIRLAILARRKEISIMRLVGASNGFIRGPFVMEGVLQAIIGAGLSILVIHLLTINLFPMLANVAFLSIDPTAIPLWLVYLALIVIGLIIGLFGSAWAMRRYLKV